nr:DUF2029 domain-containing protein [Clostridia bacterium]
GDAFSALFFDNSGKSDLFMDFFNSLRSASADNVYTERNNIYPPLGLLIYKVLGLFIPVELLTGRRVLLRLNTDAIMLYFLFAFVCLILFYGIFSSYIDSLRLDGKTSREGKLLTAFMLLSYPSIYCIERGNNFLLSFVCAAFFVFFYRSGNKVVRELALISLAVSAGIKLYPALFGLLLLFDKQYKAAVRAVVYGIVTVAVPAIFFITPASSAPLAVTAFAASGADSESTGVLAYLFEHLKSFFLYGKMKLNFSSVSSENFVYLIDPFDPSAWKAAKVVFFATEAVAAALLFFTKKRWQRLFLICYLILNTQSASSSYSLMLLTIPFFAMLFEGKERGVLGKLFKIGFSLLLIPLPTLWIFWQEELYVLSILWLGEYNPRFNQIIAVFVFQAMFIELAVCLTAGAVKSARRKKRPAAA